MNAAPTNPALLASSLIRRSITHSEIVFADTDPALEAELELAAEGEAQADSFREFWGEALDGTQWRVHLRTRRQD